MGWSGGTEIAINMIKVIKETVDDIEKRKKIYETLLETLEDADWDCVYEVEGIDSVFDDLIPKDETDE